MREELLAEHRRIEAELDCTFAGGQVDLDAFGRAYARCRELYPREQAFLATIHPEAERKIARQHAEALEIASRLEEPDTVYLARRFVAIVQHTIIEVERDILPLTN